MKKKSFILILILLSLFSGCDYICPGINDYSYDLSGPYRIVNAGHVRIHYKNGYEYPGDTDEVVQNITGIAWNDEYILASSKNKTSKEYWILDNKNTKLLGPFDKKEFNKKRTELKIDASLKLEDPEKYKDLKETNWGN